MANSISAMQEFMKENVAPMMMDSLNLRSKEKQLVGEIKKVAVDGKYYRIDVLTKGNFRLEGREERGTLPGQSASVTGSPTTSEDLPAPLAAIELKVKRKFVYSVLDFSGPADAAPQTSAGGFGKLSGKIIEQTLAAFPESVSRIWATGQAAILAQASSTAYSSGTCTVLAANAPATEALSVPWAGNRFLREGMVLDVVTTGSGVRGALREGTNDRGRAITAVSEDGATPTFTIDHATANPTNWYTTADLFVPFKTRTQAAVADDASSADDWYQSMGIMDVIQNQSSDQHYAVKGYGGLDRSLAANRILQSKHIRNTTPTAPTLDMLNKLLEQIRLDSLAGGEPDTFYSTDSVYRKFIENAGFTTMSNFATNNPARFVNPGKGFKPAIGVQGIEVNNIGAKGSIMWFTSPFAPHYRIYALNKAEMMVIEDQGLGVINNDSLTLRQISGQDAFQIQYKWYNSGMFSPKPINHGYITGVTGDHNN